MNSVSESGEVVSVPACARDGWLRRSGGTNKMCSCGRASGIAHALLLWEIDHGSGLLHRGKERSEAGRDGSARKQLEHFSPRPGFCQLCWDVDGRSCRFCHEVLRFAFASPSLSVELPPTRQQLNLGQCIAVGHHQRRCDQHTDCEIHLMAGCSCNPAPLAAREAHGLASKHLHGLLDPKPD
jgi:hypothetical protein